jgi:hypothetical protein
MDDVRKSVSRLIALGILTMIPDITCLFFHDRAALSCFWCGGCDGTMRIRFTTSRVKGIMELSP